MTPCSRDQANIFVQGSPMELDSIPEYFLAKNMHAWGAPVSLPQGETWETLAQILDTRFGQHLWHVSHWEGEIAVAHPDSLVRIALSTWLTAADSGLTEGQQGWLRMRLASTAPLTPDEKAKLKGPLLAWCTRRGIHEKVAAQFRQ